MYTQLAIKMGKKDFIDDIRVFLNTAEDMLADINYLYLANCDLQKHLTTPKFLLNLALAKNLRWLNLSHNNIGEEDLELDALIPVLKQLQNLTVVNLRNTLFNVTSVCLIDRALNQGNTKQIIVIGLGSASQPADFSIPSYCKITVRCCALELTELLEITKAKHRTNPIVRKYHAFRAAEPKPKTNQQLTQQNEQSNMPFSIIMLNGEAYIVLKFADDEPKKIKEYNTLASHNTRVSKRIKLAIHLRDQQLSLSLLKTQTVTLSVVYLEDELYSSTTVRRLEESRKAYLQHIESEHRCLQLANNDSATMTRTYESGTANQIKIKHYLTMDFYAGIDLFEWLEPQYTQLNTKRDAQSKITRLDFKLTAQNILYALTTLLGVAITHSRGIIHCDLKPENLMVQGLYLVAPIDYGLSLHVNDPLAVNNFKGTAEYLAPELRSMEAKFYSFSQDCYSIGLVLRQLLYPIAYIDAQVGSFFTSNSRNKKLQQPDPEYYLKPHFHAGIAQNYGSSVADVIKNLTETEPEMRISSISAFCKLAFASPLLAQRAFDAQMQHVGGRIKHLLKKYPKVYNLIAEFTPKLNILNHEVQIADPGSQATASNALFCLNTVYYFLSLGELCNGELPEKTAVVLQSALRDLFSRSQLSIEHMAGLYYHNPDLEEKIKFHRQLKQQLLNDFVEHAQQLMSKQLFPRGDPIIEQLLNIQSIFHEMWSNGETLPEIISALNIITTSANIDLHNKQWLSTNFAAIIAAAPPAEKYKNIYKYPRLVG